MRFRPALLVALLSLSAGSLAAQRATTKDFDWLTGSWSGKMTAGAEGAPEIVFMPPRAGLVVGTMRLIDSKGTVLVVELLTLVDSPKGVESRFRHFSAALEAYETNFTQVMRLVSDSGGRFVFENAAPFKAGDPSTEARKTTFIREGKDGFVGHSDILDANGKPGVIEVRYVRGKN